MSSSPTLSGPADRASQRDEDAQYYRGILHELVEMATDIARAVHRQATAEPAEHGPEKHSQTDSQPAAKPAPAADPTIAFDRIARTIRRTIALTRKITDPTPPCPKDLASELRADRRRIARKRIIRDMEDLIQRRTDGPDAEALQAELYDRLETIDCEDDIANLPIAEIIAMIRRDLGLAHLPGTHPWKRRKPQDVMDLHARAEGPSLAQPRTAQPRTALPDTVRPPPFAAPPPRPRTSTGPPRP